MPIVLGSPTRGDKVFGVVAIVLAIAMIVAALTGILAVRWVTIAASLLVIVWLAILRRRPPEKRVHRTRV
jgi:hypothetical protein